MMKISTYKPSHLVLLGLVFATISILWIMLGESLSNRSIAASRKLAAQVEGNWGPHLEHSHPLATVRTVGAAAARGTLMPESGTVNLKLDFKPRKKGLITHRTYVVNFDADYAWNNPEATDRQLEIEFAIPGRSTRVDQYELSLDGKVTDEAPVDGIVKASMLIPAGATKHMTVKYSALGKDTWSYLLGPGGKARNFTLTMDTNFTDYNVPAGVESPTSSTLRDGRMIHTWSFPNVTGVAAVGLEVPDFADIAKTAARMNFFGPLSLGLFFLVLVIAALRMNVYLHVMHFVLLGAACFAFQLLFSYSVDVMPPVLAFGVAALVSMALVASYLKLVAGASFMGLALAAQAAYIVIFNATFFFEGYTGLTLTIMGIITLALIMTGTAKMDWNAVLGLDPPDNAPPVPTRQRIPTPCQPGENAC